MLSEAWQDYIEARKHKWSAVHLADHEAIGDEGGRKFLRGKGVTSPRALAALMPLQLGQIDAERVKTWLRDEASRRPTQAGLAFRLLAAFIRWCDDTPKYRGIVAADACNTRIARDTLPKKNAKRDSLQKEQLKDWFAAVRAIGNPVVSAYL
ncbi:MAG: preprotein translocase, partial [Sulfuritalea sp.]|nr:preprotein translocase [Sulfuritalea sp.]